MAAPVLVDTGPLVALLDRHDPWHAWAAAQLESMTQPMLTCDAVLSECVFLLGTHDRGARRLFAMIADDIVRLGFDLDEHREGVSRLMAKYEKVPMALADACLVRMAELHTGSRVFTIDSDFRIYRRHSRQAIPLIFPED
jgi:predicted nucleic acid-binding protein